MKQTFAEMFPVIWAIVFACVIVAGLGVGSILLVPLMLLLIPYYLLKRRYLRQPTRLGLVLYLANVAVMTAVLGIFVAGFYGYGP